MLCRNTNNDSICLFSNSFISGAILIASGLVPNIVMTFIFCILILPFEIIDFIIKTLILKNIYLNLILFATFLRLFSLSAFLQQVHTNIFLPATMKINTDKINTIALNAPLPVSTIASSIYRSWYTVSKQFVFVKNLHLSVYDGDALYLFHNRFTA